MSYTIQIRGPQLLTSEEVLEHVDDAVQNSTIISDQVAKTVASLFHSPGQPGQILSLLSHGMAFDTNLLIDDIDNTLRETHDLSDQAMLHALWRWAEHWTGDYRG